MFRLLSCAIVAVAITGCTVTPPSVRVAPVPVIRVASPVVIETDDDHHHGHGRRHCPPGQAKKGRC